MFMSSYAIGQTGHVSHPIYWPEVASISNDQYKRQSSFFIADILCPSVFPLTGNVAKNRSEKDAGVVHPVRASSPQRAGSLNDVRRADTHDQPATAAVKSSELKFGIDRILSKHEQESSHSVSKDISQPSIPPTPRAEFARSALSFCGCTTTSPSVLYHSPLSYPAPSHLHRSLHFTTHRHAENFPGPYSILGDPNLQQTTPPKRKRSWSRAVFSNLQRKGLEKRFDVQKYVTKTDRRQLAAMLGLTDAQVKVWFQNRRMKWRHSKEAQRKSEDEKPSQSNPEKESSKAVQDDQPASEEDLAEIVTE